MYSFELLCIPIMLWNIFGSREGAARDVAERKAVLSLLHMILKEMSLAWPVTPYKDLTLRLKTKAKMSGQHKYSKGGRDLFFLVSR